MSELAELLKRRIAAEGPIRVADYMAEALGHPRHGYYRNRDPFGPASDFVTAPEISQMFGELIGLWCAAVWEALGAPDPVRLVELGPGRGTLMADALRAMGRAAPGFLAALRVHLVEISPALKARQRETLTKLGLAADLRWHDRLETVPEGPILVVANEFFDALPIHQYAKTAAGWRERRVTVREDGRGFRFAWMPAAPPANPPATPVAAEDDVIEVCPDASAVARAIAERLVRFGGAALVLDYGPARSAPGDTLQAVRRHAFADVLDRPGEVDLTHHVDFEALARSAAEAGAGAFGPIPQGLFLGRLGIEARARTLLRTATLEQADAIRSGLRRLVHPQEMGLLFKALALARPDLPPPPGFGSTES